MHPFVWEVSEHMSYLRNEQTGPMDPDRASTNAVSLRWVPLADTSWTPLGVMDFGVHTTGSSLHALEWRTIYARTSVVVPEANTYLLKIQSDDQMRLWIDGQEVARIDSERPVTRNALRLNIPLEKGRHRVMMRVNQQHQTYKLQGGYWQASLRFRTKDDRLSAVVGSEESAPTPPAAEGRPGTAVGGLEL